MKTKKDVKEFNIFCHFKPCTNSDEPHNPEPVFHKIIVTSTGDIVLKGHPELKSELYYHLLMVQQVKGETKKARYSWEGLNYEVPGCLQFYFSIVAKKFRNYVSNVIFYTKDSGDNDYYDRADNDRLETYLEKLLKENNFKNRYRGDALKPLSEETLIAINKERVKQRLIKTLLDTGNAVIGKFEDARLQLQLNLVDSIEDLPDKRTEEPFIVGNSYRFHSKLVQRSSRSRRRNSQVHKGTVQIELHFTKDWYIKVYKQGIAYFETKNRGKLFVLEAEKQSTDTYLVDAVVMSSGTTKKYGVQKFLIKKDNDGKWISKRKNNTRGKLTPKIESAIESFNNGDKDVPF